MKQAMDELELIIPQVEKMITEVSDAALVAKPSPDKWSKIEILGHLVDSAHNNLRRFIVAQHEQQPNIYYRQEEWVRANAYQHADRENLLTLWVLLNQQIIRVCRAMPTENYERVCNTGREQPSLHPLSFIADDYVRHLKHHLGQIFPGRFNTI